jgi:hypothetical protein
MRISSKRSQSPSLYVNCSSQSGLDSVNHVLVQITLLAGALITLTSILGGIDSANEGTRAWQAFRVLLWAAIVFDVGEAFICILAIKMCSELPLLAMEKHVRLRDGSAHSQSRFEAPRRGLQPPSRFRHRYLLLESVGMHPLYGAVVCYVLLLGCADHDTSHFDADRDFLRAGYSHSPHRLRNFHGIWAK